jgi:hypothetical protein
VLSRGLGLALLSANAGSNLRGAAVSGRRELTMKLRHVTAAVGAAALIALAAPAQAQVWGPNGRPGTYSDSARSVAFNNGYQEGLHHGQEAVRDRRPLDIEREKDFRKADEGYRREYGSKDLYRDEFRRGFTQGYQEAYARFDNRGIVTNRGYGNDRGYRDDRGYRNDRGYGSGYGAVLSVAFRNGETDGYQKGLNDARDGKYPQPERQKWYRSGDRNYSGRDGISREEYKNEYRRGFQQGYARAYGERVRR